MKNVLVEICVYVAESSHNADTDMQLFKFWHIKKKTNMFFSLGRICLLPTLHACVTLVLIHCALILEIQKKVNFSNVSQLQHVCHQCLSCEASGGGGG